MKRYILVRIGQALIAIVVVSIIVFLLGRLTGDPVDLYAGPYATAEERALVRKELGLDRNLVVQYGVFMGNAAQGDFGMSVDTERPAITMFRERFPATLKLAGAAILVSLAMSVPIGVYSAKRRGGFFDFMARMLAVFGQSIPIFLMGILLIWLFTVTLGWLPVAAGQTGLKELILPAFSLGWGISAGIMRLTRSSMLDVLDNDYIKLARIKGVSEFKVTWKHAFKNAALPVITYAALIFVVILGGTVVVEQVFGWPGVGRMVVQAVVARDFPVVQTVVIMLCSLFIFTNLVVDLLYGYLNPKIRYVR
ncbi:MAG: ABC transporter permease [Dehalococcoidia bacterium]|nr:MAG: ABC transporter permease [Dehalococcoidia bacterium]